MRALILNGSRENDDSLAVVQQSLVDELARSRWETEALVLRDVRIRHCLGCFGCWVQTPGVCLIDDAARDVARGVAQSDLTVFLTPVTFGGYSYELKKAVDRIICVVSPFFTRVDGEVHHQPRYTRYPLLMGVGVLPQPDEECEEIFTTLVARNAINMHSPAHVAGVVCSSEGTEAIRRRVQNLVARLEVTA